MRPRLRSFELAWTDAAFDAIYPEPPPPLSRPAGPPRSFRSGAASGSPASSRSPGSSPTAPAQLPHGIVRLHPARFFDDLLVDAPFEQSLGLRFALWIVALAPLFTLKKFCTISALSSPDRVRVLEKLLASPSYVIRQLVVSLKAMATLLYASSPQVRARMLAPLRESTGQLIRLRSKNGATAKKTTPGGGHEQAAE
jgi:hypothetical protein